MGLPYFDEHGLYTVYILNCLVWLILISLPYFSCILFPALFPCTVAIPSYDEEGRTAKAGLIGGAGGHHFGDVYSRAMYLV